LGIFNFSDHTVSTKWPLLGINGTYREIFSGEKTKIRRNTRWELTPWEFKVLENE
jgi:hypothetical protein